MIRAMRRKAQQLDEKTCIDILKTAKRGVLAVLGDDEYPYAIPLNFVYEKGCIYFHCAREGHKLDAIASHDKVSFCVMDEGVKEEGSWWYHVNSVIAFGRMRRVDNKEKIRSSLRALGAKYFPEGYDIDADVAKSLPRVAVLELAIEHLSGKHVREK